MKEAFQALLDPKGKYGFWGIAVLALIGIALLVLPGFFLDGNKQEPFQVRGEERPQALSSSHTLSQLENSLAKQVGDILCQVQGAGDVVVSVTLEAGYEKEFARNVNSDSSTVQEYDNAGGSRTTTTSNDKSEVVFAQNQSQALVAREIGPKIRGVLIVAEGAGDSEVKRQLGQAVQAILNVPAHRIMVLTKESR